MSWGGRGRKPDQLWLLLQTRPARTGTTGTAHSVPTQGAGPVGGRQLCRVDPTTLVSAENCANSALLSLSCRDNQSTVPVTLGANQRSNKGEAAGGGKRMC